MRFWAIATDVAQPVVVTKALNETPVDFPAAAKYSFAFVILASGHGRARASDLYAGLVIGPVIAPSPSSDVLINSERSIAHWMARRTFLSLKGATFVFNCNA